jgi:hypothetical protein
MPTLTTWFVRKLAETAPKLAFQVTASVVATLCAAFLSNALLSTASRQPAPAQDVPVADSGAHLLKANFTEGGIRIRSSYPTEFAEVFGPAPARLATGVAWSEPARVRDAAPTPDPHADKKPAARACAGECGRKAVAAVLPPPRPVVTDIVQASAAASPALAEPKRLRLLGVPLPGFVPSGETIVSTVVSLGDTVTGIIPRL